MFLTTVCYQMLRPTRNVQQLLPLLLRIPMELDSAGMFSSGYAQSHRTKFLGFSGCTKPEKM